MLLQLNKYIDDHNVLPAYLSAYIAKYSTEVALIKIVNDILLNMDSQRVTAVVALDLSAAFDTVDHAILLKILENTYGIKGGALQWFRDYLQNRQTRVLIRDTMSEDKDLPFSVPQGSCAGPVLYNIYASTLEGTIKNFKTELIGYADDHTIYDSFSANSRTQEQSCMDGLEGCLAETKQWMNANRLKMNNSKTEFSLLGNQKQVKKCIKSEIYVDGERIRAGDTMKYLGVTLDKELNFKMFVAEKCRKCNYTLRCLR